jgi:hypothetical protein
MDAKQILTEILDYYRYKIDNDLCTMEEIEETSKLLQRNMEIRGTISDFSRFYGVSEGNVRSTINRKVLDKPIRRVYYRFVSFMKAAPEKWRKREMHKKLT